jgi:hypothetical protein
LEKLAKEKLREYQSQHGMGNIIMDQNNGKIKYYEEQNDKSDERTNHRSNGQL